MSKPNGCCNANKAPPKQEGGGCCQQAAAPVKHEGCGAKNGNGQKNGGGCCGAGAAAPAPPKNECGGANGAKNGGGCCGGGAAAPAPSKTECAGAKVGGCGAQKEAPKNDCCAKANGAGGKQAIKSIKARQIFDSRGNPTIEVDLIPDFGGMFRAAVPSGASTGVHEAVELRDNEKCHYHGKSVLKAVDNVNKIIAPEVIKSGLNVTQQKEIDDLMLKLDGTDNKGKLGANAILGVSLAVCRAGAAMKQMTLYQYIAELAGNKEIYLPVPAFNVINGGSHAGNKLAMQEFMILPTGASSFTEAMKMGSEVYHHLKNVIKSKFGIDATAVGDEGGFAPNIQDNKEGLVLIKDAIEKACLTGKVEIGMDCAASEFFKDGAYDLDFKNPNSDKSKFLKSDELFALYENFVTEFPVVSIEDPFDQDDWEAFTKITGKLQKTQIVADDLTVTNPKRIKTAAEKKSANCLLLKVNQIGTVTESIEAHLLAKKNGWGTMVSHRSGETEDTFIADLVVGLSTGQIKTGAPCRSERLAKYNQILRIEEDLGKDAKYAGKNWRNPHGGDKNGHKNGCSCP